MEDIKYILSTTPQNKTWSTDMRKNFVKGAQALINLIGKIQLADPQTRQTGPHIEYESRNWYWVFYIEKILMRIAYLTKQWCREDLTALKPITK